jgi:uncharacterized membrane protein YccC
VAEVAGASVAAGRRPSLIALAQAGEWRPRWSSAAALRGLRAMVVVGGGFAFALEVLDNVQVALFVAFGGFATLVLVTFAGTWREKLRAHLGLALAGSVLLTIGTAINAHTLLAVLVTIPVVFCVFFAGVAGPNAAAGLTGALLAYTLPAASPGTFSMVPDRLAGWWLASVAGTLAVLAASPPAPPDPVRRSSAALARLLADCLDAALAGEADDDQVDRFVAAKHDLLASFTSSPLRPTGLSAPDQALANLVELLEWATSMLDDAIRERADLTAAAGADRALLESAAGNLRQAASLLEEGRGAPDLDGLKGAHEQSVAELGANGASRSASQLSFHANAIALVVAGIAADAEVAARTAGPEWLEGARRRWYEAAGTAAASAQRVRTVAAQARRHATVRSVWTVTSIRGSIALAAAVAAADLSSVQHGFWVVLGTLSVLRTNAAATGSTAMRALGGTALGFVVGGALLVAIGASTDVLWAVLPVALFVAAYTPGTSPFALGQAAFTVVVAVLFNLLVPVGWKVGVVRIEDVAIGCGVSLVVGVLFWPRGVSSVVGDDLADAYRAGAAYLAESVAWAAGSLQLPPEGGGEAASAGSRLDDALRAYLAEQGSKRVTRQELWRLVGGTLRLRLTAHGVRDLPRDALGHGAASAELEQRARRLAGWYERLADVVGKPHEPISAAELKTPSLGPAVLDASPYAVWMCEHLDHLSEHLEELAAPALKLADVRRRPWWR